MRGQTPRALASRFWPGMDKINHEVARTFIRLKNGLSTHHPLFCAELRALRQLKRDYPETDYVFMTERKGPITGDTFRKIVLRAGEVAKLGLYVHPHMLRHSAGYKLANDGRDIRSIQHYLGHKNIQNTVQYTEMSATRSKGFWSD